jgi:hypothetical protein
MERAKLLELQKAVGSNVSRAEASGDPDVEAPQTRAKNGWLMRISAVDIDRLMEYFELLGRVVLLQSEPTVDNGIDAIFFTEREGNSENMEAGIRLGVLSDHGLSLEEADKALATAAREKAAARSVYYLQAKHTPRPQFRERTGDDLRLSPPDFIKTAYAPEIAAKTLHKGVIHRQDAGLYTDLHNWLRNPENRIPGDLDLPTYKEWNTRRLTDAATKEAIRLREVEKGRAKTGEPQRPVGRPRRADNPARTEN